MHRRLSSRHSLPFLPAHFIYFETDNLFRVSLLIIKADENLSDGASEALQLGDVTAFIMRRLTNSPVSADSSTLTH